ncbi:MAG TPA: hypothetical protein IAC41_01030 [Candidatus Merdenecus merdavium]|nr:hypothetical protein [Candidatus Merdenecus merdavium]
MTIKKHVSLYCIGIGYMFFLCTQKNFVIVKEQKKDFYREQRQELSFDFKNDMVEFYRNKGRWTKY